MSFMLQEFCKSLILAIKDKDIQKYKEDAIWNLIETIYTGSPFSAIAARKSINELVFHIPTAFFWSKMQQFLLGTYRSFEDQIKMAAKFSGDNDKYEEYVYTLIETIIETIDKIDTTEKVNYFSNITRAFLLDVIDEELFYKFRQLLMDCNKIELSYIKQADMKRHYKNDMMIFSLRIVGLMEQSDGDDYVFTNLAKEFKKYALSDDETSKPPIKYLEIEPPEEMTELTKKELNEILQ